MGIGFSKEVPKTSEKERSGVGDDFCAKDLLRHLQENEGYEVYDIFELPEHGGRLSAPLRLWVEAEEAGGCATPQVSGNLGADTGAAEEGSGAEVAVTPGNPGETGASVSGKGGVVEVDALPWVVLTHQPGSEKGRGKGGRPPPPPVSAKGKGKSASGKGVGKSPPPKGGPKGFSKSAVKATAAAPPPFGKRLHWKLLPACALGDTIFEDLKPWGEVDQPLDTDQLERLLAPPTRGRQGADKVLTGAADGTSSSGVPRAPRTISSGSNAKAGADKGNGQVILLDAKRAQNFSIVLRQVTLPTEELAEVLKYMRFGHPVEAETLEHVYNNLLPSLLESPELQQYDGPPEALRNVERQLLPLARLQRVKTRVQIMLFGKTVPSVHQTLLSKVQALQNACTEVRNSRSLRRVFGTVLRVGNYLNHGIDAADAGGGAEVRGFAMESLLKLRDFRAAQGGEVSALHCVVLHLLPIDAGLPSQLRKELGAVLGSSLFSEGIADLKDGVARVQSEAELVQVEIERYPDCYKMNDPDSKDESPLSIMQRLVEDTADLALGLENALTEALGDAWRLLEYFGERPRAIDGNAVWQGEAYQAIEGFFATLRVFALSFEECWRDVKDQPKKFRIDQIGGHGTPPGATPSPPPGGRRLAAPTGAPACFAAAKAHARAVRDCSPPERAKRVLGAAPPKGPSSQDSPGNGAADTEAACDSTFLGVPLAAVSARVGHGLSGLGAVAMAAAAAAASAGASPRKKIEEKQKSAAILAAEAMAARRKGTRRTAIGTTFANTCATTSDKNVELD